jgi:hypothetical protein
MLPEGNGAGEGGCCCARAPGECSICRMPELLLRDSSSICSEERLAAGTCTGGVAGLLLLLLRADRSSRGLAARSCLRGGVWVCVGCGAVLQMQATGIATPADVARTSAVRGWSRVLHVDGGSGTAGGWLQQLRPCSCTPPHLLLWWPLTGDPRQCLAGEEVTAAASMANRPAAALRKSPCCVAAAGCCCWLRAPAPAGVLASAAEPAGDAGGWRCSPPAPLAKLLAQCRDGSQGLALGQLQPSGGARELRGLAASACHRARESMARSLGVRSRRVCDRWWAGGTPLAWQRIAAQSPLQLRV